MWRKMVSTQVTLGSLLYFFTSMAPKMIDQVYATAGEELRNMVTENSVDCSL